MNTFAFPVGICLLALVTAAAVSDMHTRRIPNWLVGCGLLTALFVQWTVHGGMDGLRLSLSGGFTGLALFLPLYLLRGMGAGDVKLMAAVGAFVGPATVLQIVLATLLVGAGWGLALIACKGQGRRTVSNMLSIVRSLAVPGGKVIQLGANSVGRLPFGVAIALGTLCVMFLSQ